MICDLGLTDFGTAYRVQKDLVARRKLGEIEDSLVLTEHTAVFTIGRTGNIGNLLADEATLASNGIAVLRVDRGGDITCHSPGQLVAYPIVDLRDRGRDLHRYLRDLEGLGIAFLARYGIEGSRDEARTGVWASRGKIASIGVGASDWITYHGISINVHNDLHYFRMINPCGERSAEVVSMETLLGRPVDMTEAKIVLMREFYRLFKTHNGILAN